MMKIEKFGFPKKRGDYYFFEYANKDEEKTKTYKIKEKNSYSINPENILDSAEFYMDVNNLPADHNNKYSGEIWSKDNKYMALLTQRAGSDWTNVYIRDDKNNKMLDDEIKWIKFSGVSWTNDS